MLQEDAHFKWSLTLSMSSQVSPMQSFQAQNHGLQIHRSCANSFSSLTAHADVGPAGADSRHHRALRSYTQERAARRRSHFELWRWMLGPGNLRRPSMHAPSSLCCCCGVMRACSVAMRASSCRVVGVPLMNGSASCRAVHAGVG